MSYNSVCPVDVPTARDKPSERDDRAVTAKAVVEDEESDDQGILKEFKRALDRGSQKSTYPLAASLGKLSTPNANNE
jgi:hypothetical protein